MKNHNTDVGVEDVKEGEVEVDTVSIASIMKSKMKRRNKSIDLEVDEFEET